MDSIKFHLLTIILENTFVVGNSYTTNDNTSPQPNKNFIPLYRTHIFDLKRIIQLKYKNNNKNDVNKPQVVEQLKKEQKQ